MTGPPRHSRRRTAPVGLSGGLWPLKVIKTVVGEDWILERTQSGKPAFVLYVNTFHHALPDPAPITL